MRDQNATDAAIAMLAVRQGGVVEHGQLRVLGLSSSGIGRRVDCGRLHRLHRGVYAVGHPQVGKVGRRWAAVLACGADAVLSHSSAAAAWDLAGEGGVTHVTVGLGGRKAPAGIRLHRTRVGSPEEVTSVDGLPVTTPARTLLDLAGSGLRDQRLERIVDRAELLRLVDFAELRATASTGRRGSPSLNAVLSRYAVGPVDTRSRLEEIVYELCDEQRLPRPNVNTVIEGDVRDFAWPQWRLVVEADSYRWHRSPSALDQDRARDVPLVLAGWRVLRFTWDQVTRRRAWVIRTLRRALVAS
jgi:very-short-patch-repair endonuclease